MASRTERAIWGTAVALLGLLAAGRLAIQVSRLVGGGLEVFGAVDLGFRFREVQSWFAGKAVYGRLDTAVYPPATYTLLWPFLGWTDLASARWIWAVTGLLGLVALSALLVRGSGATGRLERAAIALLPAAGYAAGVTLAAGQMMVHLLPAALAGVLLATRRDASRPIRYGRERLDYMDCGLRRSKERWALLDVLRRLHGDALPMKAGRRASLSLDHYPSSFDVSRDRPSLGRDAMAAALLLAALAKPNATLPLVGLGPVITRRLRPLLLALAGYLALTLFALSFQTSGPRELMNSWFPTARGVAATSGYGHLGVALGSLGLESWLPVTSLAVLSAWLVWAYRHRTADPWVLLALGALVSRTFTYHQYYDDLLLLVPTIVLLRIARHSPSPAPCARALVVCGAAILAALAPTSLHSLPSPWALLLFELPQMLVWAAMLAVLVPEASRPAAAIFSLSEPDALRTPA